MARDLKERVRSLKNAEFTLEYGRGETYNSGEPTLYAHDEYPSYSVLAGRTRRIWIESWKTVEEALKDLAECGIEFYNMLGGGSTHIPVEQMVSHLPDDTDY